MKTVLTKKTLLALSITLLLSGQSHIGFAATDNNESGVTISNGKPDNELFGTKLTFDGQLLNNQSRVTQLKVINGTGLTTKDDMEIYVHTKVHTLANQIKGVEVSDANSRLTFGKNSHITVDVAAADDYSVPASSIEYNAVGVRVTNSASLNADQLLLDVTAPTGQGMSIENSTANLGSKSVVNFTLSKQFDDYQSFPYAAIYLREANANLTADQLTIKSNNANGIVLDLGASADLKSGSNITATNQHQLIDPDEPEYVVVGAIVRNESTLSADHLTVSAPEGGLVAYNGGKITVGAGSKVTSNDHGLSVIFHEGGNTKNSEIQFHGTQAERNQIILVGEQGGSAVEANDVGNKIDLDYTDITIQSSGSTAGILSTDDATITAANTTVTIADSQPAKSVAVVASDRGVVNLNQETTIKANSGGQTRYALYAESDAIINQNGKANIEGDLRAEVGGALNLNLAAGSVLNGKAVIAPEYDPNDSYFVDEPDGPAANQTKIDLSMTDSQWHMTDNSAVSKLDLTNSTVEFSNPQFTTLTVDNLSGEGVFKTKTDIAGGKGDLLVVNGDVTGSHKLDITNQGSAKTDGSETLTVLQTAQKSGTVELSHEVEAGGYLYKLRVAPTANPEAAEARPVTRAATAAEPTKLELYSEGETTSTAQAAISFVNIGYLTNYVENQTLLQRLGDLRNDRSGKNSGAWVKGFGGKLSSFDKELSGFDFSYTGLQVGGDTNVGIDDGILLVGLMAGYTHTNPHYVYGSGSGKNYSVGGYVTYLADNGLYVDSTIKYNHMKNRFSITDSAGERVAGTGKTDGITVSAEVGKRFWMDNMPSGFYLEPQAQLTYGYQSSDTVHAANGLDVKLSHYNMTLGRASLIAGYQIDGENPLNLYAKIGVMREFDGKTSVRFNDVAADDYKFRSTWFDAGIGINLNLSNVHNIYAEADYANGQRFNKKQFDIGYRYSF